MSDQLQSCGHPFSALEGDDINEARFCRMCADEEAAVAASHLAINCKCAELARYGSERILAKHHPLCAEYDPLGDAIELIQGLVNAMDCWAADEDGIHEWAWDAYAKAKIALGQPVDIGIDSNDAPNLEAEDCNP